MNYEITISDIKNFKHLCKRIDEIENEITGLDHQLYGIHGSSFDDIVYKGEEFRQFYHGGYVSELDKIERAESLTNMRNKYIQESNELRERIKRVDYVINNIPQETKDIVIAIYWGKGWEKATREFHRSHSSLQRQMRRDIERINM